MKKYRLVLIDADETLFDFARAEKYALDHTFEEFGIPETAELLASYAAINAALWRRLERGELDHETLKTERFRLLFEDSPVSRRADDLGRAFIAWLSRASFLLEGAEELCRYLHGRYILTIITNGIREVQRSRIEGSPIRDYVSHLVISEEAKSSKPDRGIFEYACRLAGVHDKERIVIVGDSLGSDIKGGADFGIDTCWLNPGSAENTAGISPTYEVRRLLDLMAIL